MTATELQSSVIRITHALEGWIQRRMRRAEMRMVAHTRKRSGHYACAERKVHAYNRDKNAHALQRYM